MPWPVIAIGFFGLMSFIAVMLLERQSMIKSEKIIQEIVQEHFERLRLIDVGVTKGRSVLALLDDRLIVVVLKSGARTEIPLTQITNFRIVKSASLMQKQNARVGEIRFGQEKIVFMTGAAVFPAWQAALEKSAPMLAAQKIG